MRAPRRPQPPRRPRPLTSRSRLSVPRLSLPLPLPDGPHSSAAPLLGTVAAAHTLVSPLPLYSTGSVRTAHVARARQFQAAAGRAPLAGRQGSPLLVPASSTRRPPLRGPSPPLPVKTEPPPAGQRFFFSPHASFVLSVHARAPNTRPHRPGVLLTGFPPPEPLLQDGLHPSIFVVHPLR
jgi:hypothetical protein